MSRVLLTAAVVVAIYLAALAAGVGSHPLRWLRDDGDMRSYHIRGTFVYGPNIPYLESFSEYPPLATLTFAVPHLLDGACKLDRERYMLWWSCLMAVAFLITIALVVRGREELDLGPWPAALMLGPSLIYFALCRFDILCALVVSFSLLCFLRDRHEQAVLLLVVGTYLKWYPGLLLPFYLAFLGHQERLRERRLVEWLDTRTLRCGLLYLVGLLALTTVFVRWYTWEGFLSPYRFHAARGSQYFNLYWLGERLLVGSGWTASEIRGVLNLPFALLGFSGLLFLARPVRTRVDAIKGSVLAIYLFITFCRIDSPQWMLWYTPLLLVFLHQRLSLGLLALLTVVNYLVFPLGCVGLGMQSPPFIGLVLVKDLLLLSLVLISLREPS